VFRLIIGLGTRLGGLAFAGVLSGGATQNSTEAQGVAIAIDTFLKTPRGATSIERALYLGPGPTRISAPLSHLVVVICETSSDLVADAPPFSSRGDETFRKLGWGALTGDTRQEASKFAPWGRGKHSV